MRLSRLALAAVLFSVPLYAAAADLLDINTATVAQLQALPGMGAAYAQRIVAGRPYTAKNQLVTRGVLPASAYAQIQAAIVAHRPSKNAK